MFQRDLGRDVGREHRERVLMRIDLDDAHDLDVADLPFADVFDGHVSLL